MTDAERSALESLRRSLHRVPDLSGREEGTARLIAEHLRSLSPDDVIEGIGGAGVAAVFEGAKDGPRVLVRAELDALPITDLGGTPWTSARDGVAHSCGHDGHMTVAAGVAGRFAADRPERGRVVVLFQPAEETGDGARAVVADPRFAALTPDYAFAIHNLPGYELGSVVVRSGTFTCASRGLVATLVGSTAHAAYPETGRSPGAAMNTLLMDLPHLPERAMEDWGLVTIVHARLGEVAFGTAPGEAVVMATLRAATDDALDVLASAAEGLVARSAKRGGLEHTVAWCDPFVAGVNHPEAADLLRAAAADVGARVIELEDPIRWSEDFGVIGALGKGAMVGLGAGVDHPGLHHGAYDFPDELIPIGVDLLERAARRASDR